MTIFSMEKDFVSLIDEVAQNIWNGREPRAYYITSGNDVITISGDFHEPVYEMFTIKHYIYLNDECVFADERINKDIIDYLVNFLQDKEFEITTTKPNKVATLNAERNTVMPEAKVKKEKVYVEFSNKQMFNRRNIKTENGQAITLVSVSLPTSAEHNGFYIDLNEQFVGKSKYNPNVSFTSYLKDQKVPIYRYDKEKDIKEKIVLTASEVKKEFASWKNKGKSDVKKNEVSKDEPDICD